MSNRRTLEELTLKDNFLFTEVMNDPDNCKGLLERILQIEIDYVTVDNEVTMRSHPDYKGIRLDVYAKDDCGTHYSVEMQVAKDFIKERARYYHSQMDRKILKTGISYEELPNTYVIFICDWDPFGLEKYCYTIKQSFREADYDYDDGSHTIFLSTKGKNPDEVSPDLVSFLDFVSKDLEESKIESDDPYIRQIQSSIRRVKRDEEVGERFLTVGDMIEHERKNWLKEGRTLFVVDYISSLGTVPDSLRESIINTTNEQVLNELVKIATNSASMDAFIDASKDLLD